MSWLRKIAGKTRRDRIRNEVIRRELGQTETLVSRLSKIRLTWFVLVVRMKHEQTYLVNISPLYPPKNDPHIIKNKSE